MYNAARAILAARMKTWATTPICWPNTDPLTSLNVPWVRFSVLSNGDAVSYITPGGTVAESGFVAVQVFVPSGTGDGTATTLSDSIATLFRNYSVSGVQCGTPRKQTVGDADGWYQINVTIPWFYTEG